MKLRVYGAAKATASGDILELASGRELGRSLEAVKAARRVRDAMRRVRGIVGEVGGGVDKKLRGTSTCVGKQVERRRPIPSSPQ